ncbi:MAG: 9-O-acetyl-N-acetylneuraminate esterase, partial [Lachnospiraceae bacterium]|nr:9-O-acetyl-N-acetylneuraminate esterase [Lachnospiraceae bacterium]
LMIDEVDNASNNQVFVDFLAQLRGYYLSREDSPIFHSVILAGVYDIKNLKLKLRSDTEHQYNSPWNIAADFHVDMSFSAGQITAMLEEYEADHSTGMDMAAVAEELYQYTSGYPYLVSAICKIMDEQLPGMQPFADSRDIWTKEGVGEAVKLILRAKTTLFDSMMKHISAYPDMKEMLYVMLFHGERVVYNQDNHTIQMACMFGYVINDGTHVRVANRIFETRLYNLFLSEEELSNAMSREAKLDRNQFVSDGRLDMERVLAKFVEHFHDIYGDNGEKFVENDGRKFFLLYLRPIINGTGNYYIEAQTRDERRTDVIVDYAGEQFIVEMKIWHGNEYNERGEQQLTEYLNYFHQDKGYLLSFNFNRKKETGVKTITFGGKIIVEAVV